jgi:hypothetical protein
MSAGICPPFARPAFPYVRPPLYGAAAPVAVRRSIRASVGIDTARIEMARRPEIKTRQHPRG